MPKKESRKGKRERTKKIIEHVFFENSAAQGKKSKSTLYDLS